jgi:hypothetical protein
VPSEVVEGSGCGGGGGGGGRQGGGRGLAGGGGELAVAMKGDGMLPLSIARAGASLAPEKRTPMSVGREPGERECFLHGRRQAQLQ